MPKWYVGSITGEKFQSRATRGSPRRKLPDGRTETGVPIEQPPEEQVKVVEGDIQIDSTPTEPVASLPPQDVGLSDEQIAELADELLAEDVDYQEASETVSGKKSKPEFVRNRQPPPHTQKDQNKMVHMMAIAQAIISPNPLSQEDSIALVGGLWSDVLDVRIETAQTVLSGRQYAMIAGFLTVALLFKAGGLKLPQRTRQTKIEDAFSEFDKT